jgi:hypothetical protein
MRCVVLIVAIATASGLLGAAMAAMALPSWRSAAWQSVALDESFADAGFRPRWRQVAGSFGGRPGHIVSEGPSDSVLLLSQEIDGEASISYDASFTSASSPGDLSLAWYEPLPDGQLVERYRFQVGAHDNSFSGISVGQGSRFVAYSAFRAEPDRWHRIRVELRDAVLSLSVDGTELCRHRPVVPLGCGHLGLYAFYPGKQFRRLELALPGSQRCMPATAVADYLWRIRDHVRAERAYGRVIADLRSGPEVDAARYRRALCLDALDRSEAAEHAWAGLEGGAYAVQARLRVLDRYARRGDWRGVVFNLARVRPEVPDGQLDEVATRWAEWVQQARGSGASLTDLAALAEVHRQHLGGSGVADRDAALLLLELGRPAEVLQRFPGQRGPCQVAMTQLGRADEALAAYPDQTSTRWQALLALGRYDEAHAAAEAWARPQVLLAAGDYPRLEREYPEARGRLVVALERQHRYAEVLARWPDRPALHVRSLLALGRLAEAETAAGDDRRGRLAVLLHAGRLEEAEALSQYEIASLETWRLCAGLAAWAAGDRAKAQTLFASTLPDPFVIETTRLARGLLLPFLDHLAGDAERCRSTWAENRLRLARHDGGVGARAIDVALAATAPGGSPAELLGGAIGAERRGQRDEAGLAYQAYLEADPLAPSPLLHFARWRMAALASGR